MPGDVISSVFLSLRIAIFGQLAEFTPERARSIPVLVSEQRHPCTAACLCGVRERIRTSDPRILTTSVFTAMPKSMFVVWTVSSPWPESQGVTRTVSTPSRRQAGKLGSGLARSRRSERSPNLSESTMRFPIMAPNSNLRNPVLYPAELRGQTSSFYRSYMIAATASVFIEYEKCQEFSLQTSVRQKEARKIASLDRTYP
ncbi:hypothetical protein GFJ39_01265 [Gluconobacter sp. AC10]|uniref:Uncharacterized protein n=1 Tax=Gluconobacter aidae TaxID=2662454 RepID=A0A7X1SMR1_9PROT|nr:hypothetical protein [Gluconobacter aidae]